MSAQSTAANAIPSSDPLSRLYSFPADSRFWKSLVQEARMYPGATRKPHFHVDCPAAKVGMLINKLFLRQFVVGWEKANPHVVVMKDAQGQDTTYHGSREFWGGEADDIHHITDYEKHYIRENEGTGTDTHIHQDGTAYYPGDYEGYGGGGHIDTSPQDTAYNSYNVASIGSTGTRCAHCGNEAQTQATEHLSPSAVSPQYAQQHQQLMTSSSPSQSMSPSPQGGRVIGSPASIPLHEKLRRAQASYDTWKTSQSPGSVSPRAVSFSPMARAQSSPRMVQVQPQAYVQQRHYSSPAASPVPQSVVYQQRESDLEKRVRALEMGVASFEADFRTQERR
eukprot:TRINITY_DN10655_c0_g2_i2.p1 TRINITY_DN10655_c0_g2~~TRINITY_DN10655_c0_g2_i2.p1  ORF type:complete len:337 (+),score=70.18 TRINITY_DN10655_c0_g2_i2:43-1053(+)